MKFIKCLIREYLRGGERGIFACATIPDKQWVSTVYPKGKFAFANFLLNSSPAIFLSTNKKEFVSNLVGSTRTLLVPEAGLEPARYRYHWILSPARLPISPLRLIFIHFLLQKTGIFVKIIVRITY